MTRAEWMAEGFRRFGADHQKWRFICPVCKHVATPQEWLAAGASAGEIAFSCIGRRLPNPRKAFGSNGKGPCDYAGGGLFRLNPVKVEGMEESFFDFAPER